jgi:hypothetical protein
VATPDDNQLTTIIHGYENSGGVGRTTDDFPIFTFDYTPIGPVDAPRTGIVIHGDFPAGLARDLSLACAQVWARWAYPGGTTTLSDSFNVSSLTDQAVGNTTVNITQAFLDTEDYAINATPDADENPLSAMAMETEGAGNGGAVPRTTSAFTVRTFDTQFFADVDIPTSATAHGVI